MVQYSDVWYSACDVGRTQCGKVLYSLVQCDVVWCCLVQCDLVWCCFEDYLGDGQTHYTGRIY